MSREHPALEATLATVVPELERLCLEPWYVIGSAAAWLVGAHVTVADIDVLTSAADADRIEAHWSPLREETYEPASAERFRSRFSRYRFADMPVEVMGGLELHAGQGWKPVQVSESLSLDYAGVQVPVPTLTAQLDILEQFGRPKDLYRAGLLRNIQRA